ncbi:MAG: 16S rRNA processing protein RimM [Alphaproteobacteria bacterium]|nr:16S rRNA processing protein RimM [Alphaproteobacteria bacterium]
MPESSLVCIGKITGVHGVRGAVKVASYTEEPESVAAYGMLHDAAGKPLFHLKVTSVNDGGVIAAISGVEDRDAAEALKGLELYVPRSALPETEENQFYETDVIGLPVFDEAGGRVGVVKAFHQYGAGTVIEIKPETGQEILLPFRNEFVPVVDVKAGRLVVALPEEVEARPEEGDG